MNPTSQRLQLKQREPSEPNAPKPKSATALTPGHSPAARASTVPPSTAQTSRTPTSPAPSLAHGTSPKTAPSLGTRSPTLQRSMATGDRDIHGLQRSTRLAGIEIAVLIPCYNEENVIAKVVTDFKRALPTASIYVYDNASSDRTAEVARKAGAQVQHEALRGKGNVVRRMFADVEADIYLLVDGDDTYDAASAPVLVEQLLERQLDMVNAGRDSDDEFAYRPGHRFGNAFFTGLIGFAFGRRFKDILSGYRVFSRRFVKSFPSLSSGFEIETELTIHALELRMPVAEVQTPYRERGAGSESKLSTFRDGFRILATIGSLLKEERPLAVFGVICAVLIQAALILSYPLLATYAETGLVPRFPTAILCSALTVLGFLSLTCGLILDTVTRGRRELKRLRYLELEAPPRLDPAEEPGEQR